MNKLRPRRVFDYIESDNTPLPLFHRFPENRYGKREYGDDALNHARQLMGLPGRIEPRPGESHAELYMWSRIRLMLREPFLEFWGSFIMVLFGNSTLAQTYLSSREYGSWLNICFGWACGVSFGIYVAGDSGAYLNPAVTLANCLFRGLPLKRFPTYAAAQLLGMFCAAGVVYGNYFYAIEQYEGAGIRTIPPSETTSASIFCTFPATFVPKVSQFFSEFIANFVFIFCIFAMRDENGADLKGGGWFVQALFWLNFGLIGSFGWETGSPINPARDLTGRIWLSILGYPNPWSAFDGWAWIPIVVPFIATICGAFVYDMFVFTGESPVNTSGLGFQHIWYRIRGRDDSKGNDAEKGLDSSGREQSNGGNEGSGPRVPLSQERSGRSGDDGIEGIVDKDEGYDQAGEENHQQSSKTNDYDERVERSRSTGNSFNSNV